MSTIDYKIPKIQVKAEIMLHHVDMQKTREYILFLNEYSRYRKGQETIYEFLNKKKKFIPLKVVDSGDFIGMNIDDIVFVKSDERIEPQSVRSLIIFLENNYHLEVEHFNQLPDSQSRVLDYLNQESQFILFRHKECKIYVNRKKIVRVIEK